MSDPNYRDPMGTGTNRRNANTPDRARSTNGTPWAIVAICIIVIVGVAFYYWGHQGTNTASNNTSMNTASTSTSTSPSPQPSRATNQNTPAAQPTTPAAPPANSR